MQATTGDISVKIIHLAGVAYGFSQVRLLEVPTKLKYFPGTASNLILLNISCSSCYIVLFASPSGMEPRESVMGI